ncbi:DUF1570 domain-containing protein [Parasphingorhabdus sp.]|uniref:DUF1570 domain-containing protein n=1 Tax=Parasphingorhabdus sp. TaxID=2709688 RepID=UPI0030010B8A
MIRIYLGLWISMLVFHAPANAAWHEASSDHFLIYSDQRESDIQKFAERLERFHDTMRFLFKRPATKPSPSNRVTIYAVDNARDVRELAGTDNKYLQGFYVPRAGGSLAIVQRIKTGREELSLSEMILLHEYAHHFLIGSSARGYPRWLSEGFAEFYGSAKFGRDGSVAVGLASKNRAYELVMAKDVPIEQLLDNQAYQANKSKRYDSFYGQSWALYHMLHFSKEREGQLTTYLNLLNSGNSEIDAAIYAFGDLELLDKDLASYLRQRKISAYDIPPKYLKIGEIRIRPLNAAEAEMMPIRIQSKRGVDEEQAVALLGEARTIGAKYPQVPFVQSALAEAEFDAGNDAEAIAAADRAIAADPLRVNAHIQKGYAMARIAADADDLDDAWKAVRRQFVKVNKIENDHPIPLMQYYLSYRGQGIEPPEIAVLGLERALELAPYDAQLRWLTANEQMTDERYAQAAATLAPLASNPHPSPMTDIAQALMDQANEKAKEAAKPS